MELTTHQLYALFALAIAAIALIGLGYITGLKTGHRAGKRLGWGDAMRTATPEIDGLRADIEELRGRLSSATKIADSSNKEANDLRTQLQQLTRRMHFDETDREGVIRDLLAALEEETTKRLTLGDLASLKLAARQLAIAGQQHSRSGSNKSNQAALAQANILALHDRIKARLDQPPRLCEVASVGVTDTDLIEWLNDTAVHYIPDVSLVQIEIPTRTAEAPTWPPHLRDMLHATIAKDQAARSTWERIDSITPAGTAAQCM